MINALTPTQIPGLNQLTPPEWSYNYEALLRDFINEDFFFAFVQTEGDAVVGTGNVFTKGPVGWLANIIVDPHHRGKGLGFQMTQFLVDFLKERGCETQLLIATALGEPVYQKIGFRKLTEYASFESEQDLDLQISPAIRQLQSSDLPGVYQLDQLTNGENRAHLLDRFCNTGFGYFSDQDELLGFYLPEFGRGLVLAQDQQAGLELLKLKHSQKGKRTLLPIENQSGIELLSTLPLKKGARCSRMVLGRANAWQPSFIYSYGSGYCG
ncbi:MAG: GNAT family N-acetyltransferase [Phaeodactylibacter sp.]|nr:GNAT family N-acetyltransferase [Phaeodactylibacter sp.]